MELRINDAAAAEQFLKDLDVKVGGLSKQFLNFQEYNEDQFFEWSKSIGELGMDSLDRTMIVEVYRSMQFLPTEHDMVNRLRELVRLISHHSQGYFIEMGYVVSGEIGHLRGVDQYSNEQLLGYYIAHRFFKKFIETALQILTYSTQASDLSKKRDEASAQGNKEAFRQLGAIIYETFQKLQKSYFQMELCMVLLKMLQTHLHMYELPATLCKWLEKFNCSGMEAGTFALPGPPTPILGISSGLYISHAISGLFRYKLLDVDEVDVAIYGDLQCVYSSLSGFIACFFGVLNPDGSFADHLRNKEVHDNEFVAMMQFYFTKLATEGKIVLKKEYGPKDAILRLTRNIKTFAECRDTTLNVLKYLHRILRITGRLSKTCNFLRMITLVIEPSKLHDKGELMSIFMVMLMI